MIIAFLIKLSTGLQKPISITSVFNPLTGWPVQGLASVTVQAEHCLIAGTLSTITMLKGRPEGGEWLRGMGLPNLIIEEP